ncbi:uncharacterized protein LOC107271359 isoform X2 [Cephus cinctus]|uniref:Uncharacterized protein LOC107271359 isoform X2 n=1 Tax=Cephus cinctus TaxID=211228 RepID=A0AAJ7C601_CEPCN|nr:uncharacterized protein LOC107271359 isoform X2 [Cephus cinctus]
MEIRIKYKTKICRKSNEQGKNEGTGEDFTNGQESMQNGEDDVAQETSDQAQQTTPDLHQRYLVETITMTTVTERRVVREISEEDSKPGIDESDSSLVKSIQSPKDETVGKEETSVDLDDSSKCGSLENVNKPIGAKSVASDQGGRETPDPTELSLSFKLGRISLVSNSLKPNSAVRQLFPDPRFISPPPAPAKSLPQTTGPEDSEESNNAEAQKFLITTESLRLFDAVKRSKLTGAQSDSSESDSSSIKKTIERNALRRSLISKFESSSKKKNLRSKDLTLEERIRQLTCVDQDDLDTESSTSENATTANGSDYIEFPIRTSPSGEETKVETLSRNSGSTNNSQEHVSSSGSNSGPGGTHQSTYKKITDLFGQKKCEAIVDSTKNLPDLGIGNKMTQVKDYSGKTPVSKMNSDARKQFLASLAPLSCVAATAMDNREDYYQLSSKMTTSGNRDSIGYNSDSSYSLEDIDAALRGEERNYKNAAGPPDVTRGTPTGTGPDRDGGDSTSDELLAFVEQDKSRTERIKKRYNDTEEHREDDEDDELNDYGFNRRPSVRGIKPQFGSTNEIIRQLQSRNAVAPGSFGDAKAGFHNQQRYLKSTFENFPEPADEDGYVMFEDGRDTNTIDRIRTMQKQIDEMYEIIGESAVSQGTLKRSSYLESTLPRPLVRVPMADEGSHRYPDHKNGVRFPEQHTPAGARMLRIAGGGDGAPGNIYSTLPAKARRHPAVAVSTNHCGLVPTSDAKCYRTMYFVPYNGISDPTYQNIQRILPPHSSPNYANHIERYPYPRNAHADQHQQPRYYSRAAAVLPAHSQSPALHLHLHQPEEFRLSGAGSLQPLTSLGPLGPHNLHPPHPAHLPHGHPMQIQQQQQPPAPPPPPPQHHHPHTHPHQHQHQQQSIPIYGVASSVPYSVTTPMRAATPGGAGYSYQVHLGRGAADVQTQTISVPSATTSSSLSSYNMATASVQLSTISSSSSSPLSSPTKAQRTVAERGVPEGAASAPAHDFTSNTSAGHPPSSFLGHPSSVPPPNTQNSVYYAMNV